MEFRREPKPVSTLVQPYFEFRDWSDVKSASMTAISSLSLPMTDLYTLGNISGFRSNPFKAEMNVSKTHQ
jgi:hypothetical protein